MKRMLAVAAFLLASNTAQAQYEFQYGGRTIRIDPDRGTVSIPGVYDNTGRKAKHTPDNVKKQTPPEAKVDPQAPAPSPAQAAPAPAPPPAIAAPVPTIPAPLPAPADTTTTTVEPSTTTTNVAPMGTSALPSPPPAPAAMPAPRIEDVAPPPPPPAPTVAAVPPQPAPVAPAPAPTMIHDPNSPIGVWLTEEKEGKVRIEQCGPNLCGYSVDAKTNLNGEQVLINMKPGQGLKWTGRIHDPNTGSNYDSTIALKGETLRVQGCAFGGMFCGGQTWTRVN